MKFPTHHTQTAPEYESQRSNNALIGHRKDLLVKVIEKKMPTHILDLGCGTGGIVADLASRFSEQVFLGYDPETKFVTFAQSMFQSPNLQYTDILTKVDCFDLIYSIDVLHHVDDWRTFVPWVRNLLTPTGRWLLIEPNSFNLYVYLLQRRPGERPFATRDFKRLASQTGLRLETSFYYHLWPSGVKNVPTLGSALESVLEKVPVIGGSVVQIWARS